MATDADEPVQEEATLQDRADTSGDPSPSSPDGAGDDTAADVPPAPPKRRGRPRKTAAPAITSAKAAQAKAAQAKPAGSKPRRAKPAADNPAEAKRDKPTATDAKPARRGRRPAAKTAAAPARDAPTEALAVLSAPRNVPREARIA
ncbi:MAG: hypothetical protein ABW203_07905, partial [Novosphingobium sp.]